MAQANYLKILSKTYPDISFNVGPVFKWSPETKTVYVPQLETVEDVYVLLHETGHAVLHHNDYIQDIQLIKLERQAWNVAVQQLAPQLHVMIDKNFIEDSLDTYREWLHARSLCPYCYINGVQRSQCEYYCLNCKTSWKVNDARQCQLRRYVSS